ncbi:hypothetical protein NUSPORA_01806 [Nucleospora cyclopteri]
MLKNKINNLYIFDRVELHLFSPYNCYINLILLNICLIDSMKSIKDTVKQQNQKN